MKRLITYQLIVLFFLFGSCQNEEKTKVIEEGIPSFQPQLINWSAMNKSGWTNMSFPIWFSPAHIDSLNIERIEMEFTTFNFTDTTLIHTDTLPYRTVSIDFKSNGEVKKVIMNEMVSGIEIAQFTFSYKTQLDSFGYSPPAVSFNIKHRQKSVLSLLNTFQELQQYQRMVLVESDSSYLSYLDKSSEEETHHYFILDSTDWNVSFIDKKYTPEGKNIFYYGSPQNYGSSFSLINLVEKSLKEERVYYPTKTLKSQHFYANEFITKRFYNYDSLGYCVGFKDSLVTTSNDFLHLENGIISYNNELPKIMSYYNEEDSLMVTPIKRVKFHYLMKDK